MTNGEEMMDNLPRMKDTLTAKDLNTEACVTLAGVVLSEAADANVHACRRYNSSPSPENRAHLKNCRDFYLGDYFKALSCGMVEGEAVMRELNKRI